MITAQQAREMMPGSQKQEIYNTLEGLIKEAAEYGRSSITYEGDISYSALINLEALGFVVTRAIYTNIHTISWEEAK
jgi:hypothetical protein